MTLIDAQLLLIAQTKTIKGLRARVAELETAVAAQGWRPMDEPAPKGEFEVKMRCAVTSDGQVYKARTGMFVGWWMDDNYMEWRSLPDAQEATTP